MDAVAEATTRMLDGGSLRLYDGKKELVALAFANPAFGKVRNGTATAKRIKVGTGTADGIAEKWVALSADGAPVLAGDVGVDMLLSQTYIATGAEVRITSFIYSQS